MSRAYTEYGGRYWLFSYSRYYPCGGMRDFKGSFSRIEDAENYPNFHIEKFDSDERAQILDLESGEVMYYDIEPIHDGDFVIKSYRLTRQS